MRDDFCAFILTHGRPDRVKTYDTLRKAGYTGKVYIVIDDEDKTAEQYRAKFGDKVLQFCKAEVAARIDEGDNFGDRRAIIYARNVCWDLARQVGCKFFIQLDDDYGGFYLRFDRDGNYLTGHQAKPLDRVLGLMVDFFNKSGSLAVAMSQGGDWVGGGEGKLRSLRRKAMNTFICSTDKPFQFFGRINEDVNTYTNLGRRGMVFFTITHAQVNQESTQSNKGGMTDLYVDSGTYIKSFYSVMYSPSCVQIGVLGDPRSPHFRIHHKINWHRTAPKIIRETYRKARVPSP